MENEAAVVTVPEAGIDNGARCRRLLGKRILVIFHGLGLGGAERQGVLLARYLQHDMGAIVTVCGDGPPGWVARACEESSIPWRRIDLDWSGGRARKLLRLLSLGRLLRSLRPDVIVSATERPNVLCGLTWRLTGAQACIWNQGDEGIERMGRRLERLAVKLTTWFVANSDGVASFLRQELRADHRRIAVIRNGIALALAAKDRKQWRSDLSVTESTFVACMVANLHRNKDHRTLLLAWRRVLDRLPPDVCPPVLLLAGRFMESHDMLKALAYDLELGRSVRFLGVVDDIAGLWGASDLCVFSSISEGCPNGVLEAMAAGLAVVGTDTGGIREVVGETGYPYLAFPGDAEGLAERILCLMAHMELRRCLGNRNRQRVVEHFGLQQMCEETTELIARLTVTA